jgi:hypothetical protein
VKVMSKNKVKLIVACSSVLNLNNDTWMQEEYESITFSCRDRILSTDKTTIHNQRQISRLPLPHAFQTEITTRLFECQITTVKNLYLETMKIPIYPSPKGNSTSYFFCYEQKRISNSITDPHILYDTRLLTSPIKIRMRSEYHFISIGSWLGTTRYRVIFTERQTVEWGLHEWWVSLQYCFSTYVSESIKYRNNLRTQQSIF